VIGLIELFLFSFSCSGPAKHGCPLFQSCGLCTLIHLWSITYDFSLACLSSYMLNILSNGSNWRLSPTFMRSNWSSICLPLIPYNSTVCEQFVFSRPAYGIKWIALWREWIVAHLCCLQWTGLYISAELAKVVEIPHSRFFTLCYCALNEIGTVREFVATTRKRRQ